MNGEAVGQTDAAKPWGLVALEIVHPPAIAAAYILVKYTAVPTPLSGLARPLIVAVAVTVLSQLLLAALLRDLRWASLVVSLLVIVAAGFWPLVLVFGLGILFWIVLMTVSQSREIRETGRRTLGQAPQAAGSFGLILLVVTGGPALVTGVTDTDWRREEANAPASGDPDVFVIVLDAYPRTDVLHSTFGYDNSWFEAALEELGFDVARQSRSNYTATWASFASMLHMRYVDDIPALVPFPTDSAGQHRALMRVINRGLVIDEFRGRGYEIVTVPSPFESVALTSADRYLSTGHLTSLEIALLEDSLVGGVVHALLPHALEDQQRDRVLAALEATATEAEVEAVGRRPTFLLSHVMSPHAPYVFGPEGERVDQPECYPQTCRFWSGDWDHLAGQVHYLNGLVLTTVQRIATARPDAVVIVMSDHGSQPTDRPMSGTFANLLAVRSPGHQNLLPDDASLVNLFRALLDALFGTDHPPLPYRAWVSEADEPLTLTPFDGE